VIRLFKKMVLSLTFMIRLSQKMVLALTFVIRLSQRLVLAVTFCDTVISENGFSTGFL
jgi:hypothetical protein